MGTPKSRILLLSCVVSSWQLKVGTSLQKEWLWVIGKYLKWVSGRKAPRTSWVHHSVLSGPAHWGDMKTGGLKLSLFTYFIKQQSRQSRGGSCISKAVYTLWGTLYFWFWYKRKHWRLLHNDIYFHFRYRYNLAMVNPGKPINFPMISSRIYNKVHCWFRVWKLLICYLITV